jgi:putative transcriptional regulator
MNRIPTLAVLACCAISTVVFAEDDLGKGKFLVATDVVKGGAFAETVILLLNYDASGAAGLVINRPTEALPAQALPEMAGLDRYEGSLYWGGPVELFTLRALMRSDLPPDNALPILDKVYLVPLEEDLLDAAASKGNLRFFVGYSGWAPGQLEREVATGSWDIVAASAALVFADDPRGIWRRLSPPPVIRALLDEAESSPQSVVLLDHH